MNQYDSMGKCVALSDHYTTRTHDEAPTRLIITAHLSVAECIRAWPLLGAWGARGVLQLDGLGEVTCTPTSVEILFAEDRAEVTWLEVLPQ